MGDSKIAWTSKTWNPVTGCSVLSPGCQNCYAEALSLRMGWSKKSWKAQNAAENVILHPERLEQPLHWRKPARIFVNSMSDLFHELVPFAYIDRVFDVMERAPQHTFQVLTKRPERMRDYMLKYTAEAAYSAATQRGTSIGQMLKAQYGDNGFSAERRRPFTLRNVWLGTSIEDQRRAAERIPVLLDTPAVVRFLSCEPLLQPLEFKPEWFHDRCPGGCGCIMLEDADARECGCDAGCCEESWSDRTPKLHWIIDGGESGPRFRPDDQAWYRSIRDQCQAAGVAYFHKQSAGLRPATGVELDGVIWHQFPDEPLGQSIALTASVR